MPIYALDYLATLSEITSAIFIGVGILVIFRASNQMTRQQRLHNTAQLLAPYYDRIIVPIGAFRAVSADEFSKGSSSIDPENIAAHDQILNYLNSLEYIAILVNTEIVDENVAKKLIRGTIVRAFHFSIEYVLKLRAATDNSSLFQELETLAHRWGGERDF